MSALRDRPRTLTDVAMPIGPRTAAVLVLASLAGLMMLCWPLLLLPPPAASMPPRPPAVPRPPRSPPMVPMLVPAWCARWW